MRKNIGYMFISLLAFCFILTLISTGSSPVFADFSGEYGYYLEYGSKNEETKTKKMFSVYKGESLEMVDKNFNVENALKTLNAKLVYTEKIDGGISYYGYSNKIKYRTMVKDSLVNVHIFIKGERIKMGSPIIFGSY